MKKYKLLFITWFISALILLKELSLYVRVHKNNDFSYFVREYFNYVYIKVGIREELNVERFFIVLVFYLLIYYIFYSVISVNIESFKNIIKYNSSSIVNYYYNSIKFFSRIFLLMAIFNLVIFGIIFKIFYNGTNYLEGMLDLLKLPLLMYLALLIGVLFPVKRVALAVLMYLVIVAYILFFNRNPFSYIAIVYLMVLATSLTRLFSKKIDI